MAEGTSVKCSDELQEYDTLADLLDKIPKKAQRGITTLVDIKLTCVDANKDFISLGTNVGLLFLYNRATHNLDRLKCESYKETVVSVKLHDGIEHQVAFGTSTGQVYLFQIQCLDVRQSKETKLQKFCLDLHKFPVSCVHWSTNGMKLYSGSEAGIVTCTEVDFTQGQCKSEQLLKEDSPIVQLDYKHRALLISTTHRTVLCLTDQNNQLIQIGQKERKIIGPFGACFSEGLGRTDTFLYAARPSLRVWKANFSGVVESTFMFKDLMNSPHPEIPLITNEPSGETNLSELNFRKLKLINSKDLLTWGPQYFCILDSSRKSIMASQIRAGHILDIAVSPDDVIVLRQGCSRNLLRLCRASARVSRPSTPNLRDSPIPRVSPVDRISPVVNHDSEDRHIRNRSPLNFLQKKLFNKLHMNSDKELGIPLGVEIDANKTTLTGSAEWGLETETIPRFEEDSASNTSSGSDSKVAQSVVRPTAMLPSSQHPVHSATELCKDLPPIVISATASSMSQEMNTEATKNVKSGSVTKSKPDNVSKSGTSMTEMFNKIDLESQSDIIFASNKGKKPKKKGKTGKNSSSGSDSVDVKDSKNGTSIIGQNSMHHGHDGKAIENQSTSGKTSVKRDSMQENRPSSQKDKTEVREALKATTQGSLLSDSRDSTEGSTHLQTDKSGLLQTRKTISKTEIQPPSNASKTSKQDSVKRSQFVNKISCNDPISDMKSNQVVNKNKKCEISAMKIPSDSSVIQSDKLQKNAAVVASVNDVTDSSSLEKDSKLLIDSSSSSSNQKSKSVESSSKHDDDPQDSPSPVAESDFPGVEVKDISDALVQDQLHQAEAALDMQNKNLQRSEDIYDQYFPASPLSKDASNVDATSDKETHDSVPPLPSSSENSEENPVGDSNSDYWSTVNAPNFVQSLSISQSHVWVCDVDDSVYYSSLSGPGLTWKKLTVKGNQISVSPNGAILWRLYANKAYVAAKVTPSKPEGSKWIEDVKDVCCLSVDNTSCWLLKTNGQLRVQGDLKRDRPTNKATKIATGAYKLVKISCLNGVVWGVTEQGCLLVRSGFSQSAPYGIDWTPEDSDLTFSNIALGPQHVGWALDSLQNVWFCTEVSTSLPLGNRKWWQVATEQLLPDRSAGFMEFSKKLNPKHLLKELVTGAAQNEGVIAVQQTGSWLCICGPREKTINVCRSNIVGSHWTETQPLGMSSSTRWKLISAANSQLSYGGIWCQQHNGELFAFLPRALQFTKVELPSLDSNFSSLSVCKDAVWVLNHKGFAFVRAGMGPHCPLGVTWIKQDLNQMGGRKLVSVSCGSRTVWAVEEEGNVYQRLGVKSASTYQLNPAWLHIPGNNIHFRMVTTGPRDRMVWGTTVQGQIYVRIGVTDALPIGEEWVPVPGIKANVMCVSSQSVWVVSLEGELFCRRGIQSNNLVGDYWQKVPVKRKLVQISVSADGDLWGIDTDEKIIHRETEELTRETTRRQFERTKSADEGDWELV